MVRQRPAGIYTAGPFLGGYQNPIQNVSRQRPGRLKGASERKGDEIVFLMPCPRILSQDDAMNLAAWLVALLDPPKDEEFAGLLQAVRNT